MHSHQSYSKEEGRASSASTVQMSGEITTRAFNQAPSWDDVNRAQTRTNYVFGMRDGTVYIYTDKGIQATIPLKRFINSSK